MGKLKQLWTNVRSSLWFIPFLVLAAMIALAYGAIELDSRQRIDFSERWPRFFAADPEGSRAMLGAIATSMITVAGVVFSITIVALAQASTQYSPRVLRNFMRDRRNQVVLGAFVGIYAYCLVVLRNVTGTNGDSVPSLAVLAGFLLSLLGIVFLIYFIHHIATSIQATEMVAAIAAETTATIRKMYPESPPDEQQETEDNTDPAFDDGAWHKVPALATGYLQQAEVTSMFRLACDRQLVVRMANQVGEFVIKGRPIAWVSECGPPDQRMIEQINACFGIDSFRTIDQDPSFGVRQIVDIALKALSPGINDTGTALTCVDYLSAILCELAPLRLGPHQRLSEGTVRVLVKGVTFSAFLKDAFSPIIENAEGNSAVLMHLLRSLERISEVIPLRSRRRCLEAQLNSIAEIVEKSLKVTHARREVEEQVARVRKCITGELRSAERINAASVTP